MSKSNDSTNDSSGKLGDDDKVTKSECCYDSLGRIIGAVQSAGVVDPPVTDG